MSLLTRLAPKDSSSTPRLAWLAADAAAARLCAAASLARSISRELSPSSHRAALDLLRHRRKRLDRAAQVVDRSGHAADQTAQRARESAERVRRAQDLAAADLVGAGALRAHVLADQRRRDLHRLCERTRDVERDSPGEQRRERERGGDHEQRGVALAREHHRAPCEQLLELDGRDRHSSRVASSAAVVIAMNCGA